MAELLRVMLRVMDAGQILLLTSGGAACIITNHNRERDDEKKYLCLRADRELPVGERRGQGRGKYISEQQAEMWESFF